MNDIQKARLIAELKGVAELVNGLATAVRADDSLILDKLEHCQHLVTNQQEHCLASQEVY